MSDLTRLPDIGPTFAKKLNQIGVSSHDELVEKGSIEAVTRIDGADFSTCYNLHYALESTIRGLRWHGIPRDDHARLKGLSIVRLTNYIEDLFLNDF